MKRYKRETVLTFGKYEGQTVEEILQNSPSYIRWCLNNLDHFYIDDEEFEEFSDEFSFTIDPFTRRTLEQKTETFYRENDYERPERSYHSDYEMENSDWDYDPMNEAHNQYENPWIDVFGPGEEAEVAYWNCD